MVTFVLQCTFCKSCCKSLERILYTIILWFLQTFSAIARITVGLNGVGGVAKGRNSPYARLDSQFWPIISRLSSNTPLKSFVSLPYANVICEVCVFRDGCQYWNRQGSHSFSVQGTHIHVFLGPKTFGDIFLVRSILSAHPWFDHSSKGVYRVTCFPDWWSSADWRMFSPTRLIIAIILVHWDCFCENFTFYNIGNFHVNSWKFYPITIN